MSIFRLVLREILYRRLNFLLGVVAVSAAVGCLTAVLLVLREHDRRTDEMIAAKEAETGERMKKLEDDYRKINKEFNLLILPRDQNLGDLYADDYAARTMPEEYARKLAEARVLTINHVMPMLQQKLRWPERDRTILLTGVRGEIYVHSKKQEPIRETVPAGRLVVGHELHRSLGLTVGSKVLLLGREFIVAKLHDERGTKDDITIWINLDEAQELLKKPGQINGILALECGCAADRLSKIRDEIERHLPQTQVVEFASQAVARAEARSRAAVEAVRAVEQVQQTRAQLRREREATAAVLLPVVLIGAALWIALLTLANVRDRAVEVGIWRALGWRTRQVVSLFLTRALLTGLLGAVVGLGAGWATSLLIAE